jgi:Flp pilus assembly protein TadD
MKHLKSIVKSGVFLCCCATCLCISGCPASDELILEEGRQQLSRQAFAEAYQTFSRYLLIRPDDSEGYLCRGFAATALKQILQAEADIERAIALSPENRSLRWVHFKLISQRREILRDSLAAHKEASYANHTLESALEILQLTDLDQLLRMEPDDVDARYERGKILRNRGELNQAKRDLDLAFESSPKDPWILNERGRVLHDLGDFDRAIWQYSLGLTVCDTCNWLLFNKALSLKSDGRVDDAIEALNELVTRDSVDGEAWLLLADCHMLLGHRSAAHRAYSRSAALGAIEAAERLESLRK